MLIYYNLHNIVGIKSLVHHTTAGNPVERDRRYSVLKKCSVFIMLLLSTSLLVGISSVYQLAEAEMQLLQLLPPPPLLPPGPLPGLPPVPPTATQPPEQQSSGGSTIR